MVGTTSSGFKFDISDDILKDWRFVKCMAEFKNLEESDSQEVDFINATAKLESILFKDKGKAFEKHIASQNDGLIPTDVLMTEIFEIIQSNDEVKN